MQLSELVTLEIHGYFTRGLLAGPGAPAEPPVLELAQAMLYSAGEGGKRFRPVLSLLIAEVFDCPRERVLPFAMAVEMIHTYSLIHDDLPSMDNDDLRRGKPTNHKVYGEATALLAGDALLTEAFLLLARDYQSEPATALKLVQMLSLAAGVRGMVGGQAIDLKAKDLSVNELTHLHELKTGRLIQVAAEGAAVLAGATTSQQDSVAKFGATLGLAFQVADDILDQDEKDQGPRSFVTLLGVQGTKGYLKELSDQAREFLRKLPRPSPALENLIEFNLLREK
jgi:geranylgeranyl diphosphate synthase type II